jgi:hypothetical protein
MDSPVSLVKRTSRPGPAPRCGRRRFTDVSGSGEIAMLGRHGGTERMARWRRHVADVRREREAFHGCAR